MARLPQPGQDSGTWGDLLNEFLEVEHNNDGTLKAGASLSNKYTKPPTGIPEADLATAVQTKLNAAGSGGVADDSITTAKVQDTAITKAKLATAVQTTLDKADTALQSIADGTITEPKLSTAVQTKLNQPAPNLTPYFNKSTDTTDAITESTTKKFLTTAEKTKLSALSGTNTGDQDISGLVPKTTTINSKALTGNITLTGTDLSLTKSDVGLGNVDNTSDVNKPFSTTALNAHLLAAAKNPDLIVTGTVTGDPVTSAQVIWQDGTPGTLTITSRHSTGAVTAYNITYGSPVTKTFTQPTITRSATGAATNVPQIVIS